MRMQWVIVLSIDRMSSNYPSPSTDYLSFGKKRQIYIFSRVEEDNALDRFRKKSVTRIPLGVKLWSEFGCQTG